MEQLFDLVLEDIKVGSIQVSHKLLILGNCRKLLFLTLAVSNDQNIWYVLMRLKSTLFLDRFTFLRGFLNRIDENHRLLFDLFFAVFNLLFQSLLRLDIFVQLGNQVALITEWWHLLLLSGHIGINILFEWVFQISDRGRVIHEFLGRVLPTKSFLFLDLLAHFCNLHLHMFGVIFRFIRNTWLLESLKI